MAQQELNNQNLEPMRPKTLGEYLLDCLKQEGLTDIFGVPGDYNFSLLERSNGTPDCDSLTDEMS